MSGWQPPPSEPLTTTTQSYNFFDLTAALGRIPNDATTHYDLWLKVGLALHHTDVELLPTWVKWSELSPKHRPGACEAKWHTFATYAGTPVTIATIYHLAKTTEPQATAAERYPLLNMDELLAADFNETYIIEEVLIHGVPGIVGAPSKTLKTAKLLDAAYALSTGGKFLDHFQATRCRVIVLTGESGGAAIQRRVNTLVANHNGVRAAPGYFHVSESLPKFKNPKDIELLAALLAEKQTEVLIIDPMYMCMGGSEASNIQSQGELLWAISDVCRKAKVTLLIAHHVTKTAAREVNRFLTLEDLTQAGFAEWARQWILISRREKYELGTGLHKLWVALGNCSSHSAEWAVDIDEGTKDEPRWEVQVCSANDAQQNNRDAKRQETFEADVFKVRVVLQANPEGMPSSTLRNAAGISGSRWKATLPELINQGIIKSVPGKKSNCHYYILGESNEQAV